MAKIICYDNDGQVLERYTQWDKDQKLLIKGIDTGTPPYFHFSNGSREDALVVRSEFTDDGVVASVPDILLQYALPIIVFVYYFESSSGSSAEFSVRIPVMPRAKPSDYIYVEKDDEVVTQYIDVVDNLVTNDPHAALSAAQGFLLKSLLDDKLSDSELPDAITEALNSAIESGEFSGSPGKDGVGIVSISQILGNGSPGTVDVYRIALSDGSYQDFTVYNGADGASAPGDEGTNGENGATFIPFVDEQGNLSWTNDKGLDNPEAVNIKGSGGEDGFSPLIEVEQTDFGAILTITDAEKTNTISINNGKDGVDGSQGKNGKDGVSITHSWNGTILNISSASGSSSVDLVGPKGDYGEAATLVSSVIEYATGASGVTAPSSGWRSSMPSVVPGSYLWIRATLRFNTGDPVTMYTVSRFGADGINTTTSVCGQIPDSSGNITLTASQLNALPISGGTLDGQINMNSNALTGLKTPTSSSDAATKAYVDRIISVPACTASDNGKILTVSNGSPVWTTVPIWAGGSY